MKKTFKYSGNNYNSGISFFHSNSDSTNYSSIIDDIILADIIDKNKYLFNKPTKKYTTTIDDGDIISIGCPKLYTAGKFITNYKKYINTYKLPFKLNEMYTLTDGTPIIFYDDEVQIGFDTYKYSNFSDLSFLNNLSTKKKNIIINIYTKGAANININLL